jgi:hypothetical protein
MIIQLKPALLALVLSTGLSACNGASEPTVPEVTKKAEGVEITLKAVEVSPDVGTMGLVPTAPEGATYIHVTYGLKNVSAGSLPFEKWPQPRLVDPAGNKLEPEIGSSTALSAASNPSWFENLNPNLSTDAHLVWKVDEKSFDRATWTLTFLSKPAVTFPLK